MHIYVYGSVCRGDIVPTSDVDLLALVDSEDPRLDPAVFSVYPYSQLTQLWSQGNPFAWHLALESRLVLAEDGIDFIRELGRPVRYRNWRTDSDKFRGVYFAAKDVLATRRDTTTFELSTVYLAVRNLAICFSLHVGSGPVFSRRAFEKLGVDSLELDPRSSGILEDARILSTRGVGAQASEDDVEHVLSQLPKVERWMSGLLKKGRARDD
jgi:predicted nucleotidyltransferase